MNVIIDNVDFWDGFTAEKYFGRMRHLYVWQPDGTRKAFLIGGR